MIVDYSLCVLCIIDDCGLQGVVIIPPRQALIIALLEMASAGVLGSLAWKGWSAIL